MANIPNPKLQEFMEAFKLHDKDNDGSITLKELTQVLKSIKSDFTLSQIESIISDADLSGIEKLKYDDFINLMALKYKVTDSEEDIINAFKVFDKEGNGVISCCELRHIMTSIGDNISEEEVNDMIREHEINGEGYIFYEDFVKALISK